LAVKNINPYLFFNGTASDAITFYVQAIEAKIVRIQRFSDAPGGEMPPGVSPNAVMHAHLETGGGTLMISDAVIGPPIELGDGVVVCLQYEGRADIDRHFAALAEGGKATEPLQDTFWGARFGMLTDKFGIRWMFNATLSE